MTTDVISITLAAEEFLAETLEKNPGKQFKISVNSKGCAGHKYQYDLVSPDQVSPADEFINKSWGTVVIDAASVMYLLGSTLNLKQDLFSEELVWYNPLAVGTCGCGASFSTDKDSCSR